MIIGHAAEEEIDLVRRVLVGESQEQLGDDLVGAGEVDHRDVREVDDRERPFSGLRNQALDLGSHGDTGGTGDQVGVQLARDSLSHQGAQIDVVHHFGATRSGIVT
jgi:hypothetical protein